MLTVMITGGTGLLGKALSNYLSNHGYHVIILSRQVNTVFIKQPSEPTKGTLQYARWDIKNKEIDLQAFRETDYIIHLAGAGVMDKKWTKAYKQEIVNSRVESSKLLLNTLITVPNHVKAFIGASAIGFYGEDKQPPRAFVEEDPPASGFLAETCSRWEESTQSVTQLNIRRVILRIGIVLSKEGGALRSFMKPMRFRVAPILGNGKQMVSWIHIADLCRMILFAIENEQVQGYYNAVAPEPINNLTLNKALASKMKGSFYFPFHVPSFLLKWLLGEKSIEVLKSTTVSSEKIQKEGFRFDYPTIDIALNELIKK